MRTLTMNGYLETRVRELGGNTVSLPRLVRRASESPRLWGPLILWSAASGRSGRLARLMGEDWPRRQELDELVRLADRGLLDTWSPVTGLGSDVLGAWRDWLTARDAPLRERQEKAELRERILAMEPAAGTHRYTLGRVLGLNPGNLYAFLERGELRTLRLDSARAYLESLERADSPTLDRIVSLAEGQAESDIPELLSLAIPAGLGSPARVAGLLRARGSRVPLGNGGVERWLMRYALQPGAADGWEPRTGPSVRTPGLGTLASELAAGRGFEDTYRAVKNYAMDVGSSSQEERTALLAEVPPLTGISVADALTAGLAELWSRHYGIPRPRWADEPERKMADGPVYLADELQGRIAKPDPDLLGHGIVSDTGLAFKD